jgi:hypothetical protein
MVFIRRDVASHCDVVKTCALRREIIAPARLFYGWRFFEKKSLPAGAKAAQTLYMTLMRMRPTKGTGGHRPLLPPARGN